MVKAASNSLIKQVTTIALSLNYTTLENLSIYHIFQTIDATPPRFGRKMGVRLIV